MKSFSQLLLEKNNKTSSKKGISDSEINKRLSASTTKGDQARSQYGADGGYGDSNVGDATTNKSLKKGKPFTKAQSDAIQIRSLSKKTKKFVNKPGTTKSKGPGASTGGQKNLVVNPKSKGTTPVTISKTKTVKQSEVSKKALEFTAKVNKRRIERGTKKAERIKDATGGKKTGSLRKGNLSFAGDRSGAYRATKFDIDTRTGFQDLRPGGLKADEKNPFVKRTVRKGRVDKLGGDIYDAPKFSQKKFDKSIGGAKKPTDTAAPGSFGKGDTKGQMNVKAMNKKSFKVTQPKDVKLPKSFTDFSKKIKKYRVDREIEKKINQPSYQIKSKGSGASTGVSSANYSSTSSRTGSMKGGSKPKNGSSSAGGGGGKPPKPPKPPSSTPPSGGGKAITPEVLKRGEFIEKGKTKITFGKGPDYVPPKAAKVGLGKKVLKYVGKLKNPKVALGTAAVLGGLALAKNQLGPKPEGKKKDTLTDKDFKLATKTGIVKKDGSQVRRNLNFGKKVKNQKPQETTSSISKKLGKKEYRVK